MVSLWGDGNFYFVREFEDAVELPIMLREDYDNN